MILLSLIFIFFKEQGRESCCLLNYGRLYLIVMLPLLFKCLRIISLLNDTFHMFKSLVNEGISLEHLHKVNDVDFRFG